MEFCFSVKQELSVIFNKSLSLKTLLSFMYRFGFRRFWNVHEKIANVTRAGHYSILCNTDSGEMWSCHRYHQYIIIDNTHCLRLVIQAIFSTISGREYVFLKRNKPYFHVTIPQYQNWFLKFQLSEFILGAGLHNSRCYSLMRHQLWFLWHSSCDRWVHCLQKIYVCLMEIYFAWGNSLEECEYTRDFALVEKAT